MHILIQLEHFYGSKLAQPPGSVLFYIPVGKGKPEVVCIYMARTMVYVFTVFSISNSHLITVTCNREAFQFPLYPIEHDVCRLH